jgi:lysophospholipase L1-like esterase
MIQIISRCQYCDTVRIIVNLRLQNHLKPTSVKNKMNSSSIIQIILLLLAIGATADISFINFSQGRFDFTNAPTYAQFDWPAVVFELSFSVSQPKRDVIANVTLSDQNNLYNVELWNTKQQQLIASQILTTTKAMKFVYTVKFSDVDLETRQTYSVRFVKRTEGFFGVVQLFDLTVNTIDNSQVKYIKPDRFKSSSRALKIEWIGDSLSCGYGNGGTSPCTFSAATEDGPKSFPVVTSYKLDPNAQYSLVCYSGKGVVRNYGAPGQTSPDPMPVYYNRTLTSIPDNIWNFKQFVPDLVIITLGGNDFSTKPTPSYEIYSNGYNKLIDTVRQVYNSKTLPIVGVCGPLTWDCFEDFTQNVISARADPNIHFVSMAGVLDGKQPGPDYGCDGHPSILGDEKMSVFLAQKIREFVL